MKTAEIKDLLKKDLLIIELPRVCDYNLYEDILYVFDNENDKNYRFKGSYTLLGKADEIKEEDAEKLFYNPIDSTNLTHYANLRNLFSLLESEIYWENPWGVNGAHLDSCKDLWHEAQEKTFDKNKTLIFVKN